MKKFQEKEVFKSRLYSKPALILFGLVTVFALNGSKNIWIKYFESKTNTEKTERELNLLKEREKSLKDSTNRLQSPEGIEEEIRDKFNVLKPGETVLIVHEEEVATTSEKQGFWLKLKEKIGF